MVKSKTKISKQLIKKSNPELVETIIAAKKNRAWLEIAAILSGSRKNFTNINLQDLAKYEKGVLVVPGKVLSLGEVDKKVKIAALSFSKKAGEKLNKSGNETISILKEIKKNPDGKNIKIIRKK